MTNPADTGPGEDLFKPVTDKANNQSNKDNANLGANDEPVFSKVKLSLVYPQDLFRYGPNDDDVITGRKGKVFDREEADKIKDLAGRSSVTLIEEGAE